MEKHVKEKLIIDFTGTAGCGKSTVSHMVADKLRERGGMVKEPTYNIEKNRSKLKRYLYKIIALICVLLKHGKRVKAILRPLSFDGRKEKIKQMINVCYVIHTLNGTKADYVVADQGVAQAVTSLFMKRAEAEDEIKAAYFRLAELIDGEILTVFITLQTPELNMDYLRKRGTRSSRLDQIDDDETKRAMIQRNEQNTRTLMDCIKTSFILDNSRPLHDPAYIEVFNDLAEKIERRRLNG